MAFACVNSATSMSQETAFSWITPSRVSFAADGAIPDAPPLASPEKPDSDYLTKDFPDFEFLLDDPVAMLSADELFSNGKLVPLHLAAVQPAATVQSEEPPEPDRVAAVLGSGTHEPSAKAAACSSRWRELLGLKKEPNPKPEYRKPAAISSRKANPKVIRAFLKRSPKVSSPSSPDSSLSLPLLGDAEPETADVSSGASLFCSSPNPEHEVLPRLSLDSDKPSPCNKPQTGALPPRVRVARPRPLAAVAEGKAAATEGEAPPPAPLRGPAADSPRLNAAGKVVFEGLERSSSSPSSLNGGPRMRHRGIERSYSANVRIAPVLNVPVCSLRGSRSRSVLVFGFERLFAPQRRAGVGARREDRWRQLQGEGRPEGRGEGAAGARSLLGEAEERKKK